jgi:hypothetical protein
LALGGKTIAEWQAVMTEKEYRSWVEFYRMSPFDDLHRFHRPAALIARSFSGGDVGDLLEWLQPRPEAQDWTQADINTFKAFGAKPPPRS